MAASDLFRTVVGKLRESERANFSVLIERTQADLLAARSEEARVRIVHHFIDELHAFRAQGGRRSLRSQSL